VNPRHGSNTSASGKRIRQRVMPRSENTICAIVSPRKDLVRGTNPPTEQRKHTTDNMHVLYMARNDLPLTDHYVPSAEDARRQGDVGLSVKCRTLLYRMWILNSRECSVTASWMRHWSLKEPIANPPNRNTIPNKLTCHTLCTRNGICKSTREH